jgi:hypothetical protein
MMKKVLIIVFVAIATMFTSELSAKKKSCTSGGEGATSCSITVSGELTITLYGAGGSVTQAVSCGDGYYACCNVSGAKCIEEV